jgi:hypothetical protein
LLTCRSTRPSRTRGVAVRAAVNVTPDSPSIHAGKLRREAAEAVLAVLRSGSGAAAILALA